jgi:hypothetical protein
MSEQNEANTPSHQGTQADLRRKRVLKWLPATIGLIIFVLLVVVSIPDLLSNVFGHAGPQASCAISPAPASSPDLGLTGKNSQLVTATLESGQMEEVDFGRSVTSRAVTVYLELSSIPSGSAYFHVRINPFVRSDDAMLRPQNIVASAVRDGTTLLLNVCFNRSGSRNATLGDPGSYTGSVTIDDSRLSSPASVPITVTMQYSNGVFLLWLYFGAVIPGAWCIWVIREKRDGASSAFSLDFLRWAKSINGVVAIVAGSVSAFAVYMAVYLRDPTWGSSALQPLTLYGGMFSAFVTTSGLASLTGKAPAGPTELNHSPASRHGTDASPPSATS